MNDIVWIIKSSEEEVTLNILKEPVWEQYGDCDHFIILYAETIIPRNANYLLCGKRRGIKWGGRIENIEVYGKRIRIRLPWGWEGYSYWHRTLEEYRKMYDEKQTVEYKTFQNSDCK